MAEAKGDDQFGWQASALLFAADPRAGEKNAALVTASGGRVVASRPLGESAARLADQAPVDLVLMEASGGELVEVAAAIDASLAYAQTVSCAIIVVIDRDQIDLVGGTLLGGAQALLCAPSQDERRAAIIAALHQDRSTWLNDAGRDSEAARLNRLNDEVARIAETLARLTRPASENGARGHAASTGSPAVIHDQRHAYFAPDREAEGTTAAEIRRIIRGRRLRDQILGEGLFEDPAWDMLLDLYAAHLEGSKVSVSSLCIAAAVPPTTALRWIGRMSELGMLERCPDPFDRRRAYMVPAQSTIDGMARYFAVLRQGGFSAS